MDIGLSIVNSQTIITVMDGAVKFGALIKSAREAKGLTGQELSAKLGRAHSFVVRMERGQNSNPPDPLTLRDLSLYLDLTINEMLEALDYIDADADVQDPIPTTILRELRSIDWTPSWKVELMLESIRSLRRMEERVREAIREEGGGYE